MKVTAIISLELSQFPYIYGPITISVVTCKSRLKNSKWLLGNSKQSKIQETQVVHLFSFTGYKVTSSWFHFCSQFQFLLDFSSTLNLLQDFWGLRELELWAWTSLILVSITYILNSSLRATRYNIFYNYIYISDNIYFSSFNFTDNPALFSSWYFLSEIC